MFNCNIIIVRIVKSSFAFNSFFIFTSTARKSIKFFPKWPGICLWFIVIYLILCLIVELFQKVGQSELYNLFTKIRGTQRTQIITEWAITLVSCLGKLFTAIINNRLSLHLIPSNIHLQFDRILQLYYFSTI
jgi:hypothetical protein